jgi:23S rRNA pseudouridine2605 synthase
LNKFIAGSGICSRREADQLIADGWIKVNGEVVKELGRKVSKSDSIYYKDKKIECEKHVYVVLNKPKGVLTTVSDELDRKTVMDFFKGKITERIYPVGRLDKDTTGVLLLTNDGELTKKLTHPAYSKKKIYHVFLDKDLKNDDFEKLLSGLELEDGFMKFDDMQFPDITNKKAVGVEIHSGRNRIIKRMFEALRYTVVKLDRVYFAGLTKKDLKRGRWRYLTQIEISNLKRGSYE